MKYRLSALVGLCLGATLGAGSAVAHEFWISPDTYAVPSAGSITAAFRVGENLKGSSYSYIDKRSARLGFVTPEGPAEVPARMGDRPALNAVPAPVEDGLVVIVHETIDMTLTYSEWQKFINFVEHKDFEGALERHAERGIPQEGFKETYRRFAKSLVAVGSGAGADAPTGMETEIVALANPYTDDLSDGIAVQVLYQGAPRADAQVELFEKQGDVVEVTLHRTDAEGIARLPVKPGYEYLVDAVVLRDTGVDNPEEGAVWHSLWASLTFAVPD